MSGHKLYAPKGMGVLFVRKGTRLRPLMFGGRHERDRRPGTENVPGAVALGCAAEMPRRVWRRNRSGSRRCAIAWSRRFSIAFPDAHVNGRGAAARPIRRTSVSTALKARRIVISLDLKGFAVSSGSACSSGAVEPSHVLLAIGLSRSGRALQRALFAGPLEYRGAGGRLGRSHLPNRSRTCAGLSPSIMPETLIAVAMSGGVDSSAVAGLLRAQGHARGRVDHAALEPAPSARNGS